MDIKEFKKGQSVYMLSENRRNSKVSETSVVTVVSVGRKYVTVSGDTRFQSKDTHGNCLIENKDWGDRRLLFADKSNLDDYLEKKELITWLHRKEPRFGKLSLQKLQQIRQIVEEPEQKGVALEFDRDGNY